MRDLIEHVEAWEIAHRYDADAIFSKFLKKHGDTYTQEELLRFLKARYEAINKADGPKGA